LVLKTAEHEQHPLTFLEKLNIKYFWRRFPSPRWRCSLHYIH